MSTLGALVIQLIVITCGRPQKITVYKEVYITFDEAKTQWERFRTENHGIEGMSYIVNWIPNPIAIE